MSEEIKNQPQQQEETVVEKSEKSKTPKKGLIIGIIVGSVVAGFSLLMVLVVALALIGKNSGNTSDDFAGPVECTHENAQWNVTYEPRCNSEGLRVLFCDDCNESLETQPVEPIGHSFNDKKCNDCGSIQIETVEDFYNFCKSTRSGKNYLGLDVYLMNDIDLTGKTWIPIKGFKGTFDGQGHKIIGLGVENLDEEAHGSDDTIPLYFGLFDNIEGTIRNLGLTDVSFVYSGRYASAIGSLVAYNRGTIENCYAEGNISLDLKTSSYRVGGLVGENLGNISRSYANVQINSSNSSTSLSSGASISAGGLVGDNSGGTVSNCYATGDVTARVSSSKNDSTISIVGGLCGNGGGMENCYALGNVSGNGRQICYVGALSGTTPSAINCFAAGKASGSGSKIGDLCGGYDEVVNCYYLEGGTSKVGTAVDADTLRSAAFQKNSLKLDDSIWNLTDGSYPTLK